MLKNLFYRHIDKIIYYTFLFFAGAFVGGIIEVSYIYLTESRFVLGGFMYFLWRPMYGWAAIFLDIMLSKFKHNPLWTFIISMILCTIFEYGTSVILEVLFHKKWWNYSNMPFNFQGRICLLISIGWGIIGWLYNFSISPTLNKIYDKIKKEKLYILLILLIIFYKIDEFFSFIRILK